MKELIAAAIVFLPYGFASAETFQIDPAHSSVSFRVRHLVSKVTGRFNKFEGNFDYEKGKPGAWKTSANIDPASINTDVPKRDDHLRSPDFFDVAKCPEMAFKSTKVDGVKGDKAKLHGDLTLHCVTKPVVLDLELAGTVNSPMGLRAGATATGKVNRKDFGIVWNKTLDSGGLMLGDDVEITIEVEGGAKKG
ncbi:MAG: YceI family protein [Elusimicrobia bacterium]|nr:YceI family protein [Elusimicrobiota bacterium]